MSVGGLFQGERTATDIQLRRELADIADAILDPNTDTGTQHVDLDVMGKGENADIDVDSRRTLVEDDNVGDVGENGDVIEGGGEGVSDDVGDDVEQSVDVGLVPAISPAGVEEKSEIQQQEPISPVPVVKKAKKRVHKSGNVDASSSSASSSLSSSSSKKPYYFARAGGDLLGLTRYSLYRKKNGRFVKVLKLNNKPKPKKVKTTTTWPSISASPLRIAADAPSVLEAAYTPSNAAQGLSEAATSSTPPSSSPSPSPSSSSSSSWWSTLASLFFSSPSPSLPFDPERGVTARPGFRVAARDDETCGKRECRPHGFCREGECVCARAWRGETCKEAHVSSHDGLYLDFNGYFTVNKLRLDYLNNSGLNYTYTSNPKVSGKRRAVNVTVSQELYDASPDVDAFASQLFDRCAIVGSSGVLLKYDMGEEIDSHDCVIRFNAAPTLGYDTHVGKKTTMRLVNTQHAGFQEGKEVTIQQMQSQAGIRLYAAYKQQNPDARHYAFDFDFSRYVSSNLGTLPTGGFFAVFLALQRCASVRLYGFHFQPGFGIGHHYFNDEEPVTAGQQRRHHAGGALRRGLLQRDGHSLRQLPARHLLRVRKQQPTPHCNAWLLQLSMLLLLFLKASGQQHCFRQCTDAQECPGGATEFNEPTCPASVESSPASELLCRERTLGGVDIV
eukprot:jgi/Chlat1/4997/Chrsp32S04934